MNAPNPDNLAGTVVAGKYELVRLLGQGGMGAVYEGRNNMTLKRVAVKLLYEELGRDEQVVKRFFREAQASSVIESDYIVTIFDSGTDPALRFPYMVMEMLHGEDIEELLKRTGPLEPLGVAKIILQATMGLAKAHERGITHRDIKPANLYLTEREAGDCVVKILDFGIAKIRAEKFQDQSSQGLTATGSVLGTPLYMSPEQARGLATVDARSDVWSMGIVMFEMLSGNTPYTQANTLGDLIVAIVTSDLPLLQDRAPWVPPELAEICHRAISRDLDKRFKDAGELRDALAAIVPDGPRFNKSILNGISPEVRQIVAPRLELTQGMLKAVQKTGLSLTSTPPPRNRPKSKHSMVAATTTAVTLLAVAGAGVAVWKLGKGGGNEPGPTTASQAAPPALAPAPPAEAVPAAQPAPGQRSFQLVILTDGATVTIDGQPATVRADAVMITGSPGSTRTVKVEKDGQSAETIVAITENGLVPPKVQVQVQLQAQDRAPSAKVAAPSRPPARGGAGSGKPAGGAAAGTPQPAPPTVTAPDKRIITDTNEFQ